LQDQYAQAVTAPYEDGKTALETKYGSALAAAAKAAQQAGLLEEVLALTQEQKRLADGLPIPEEEDGAPESLKKLRAIYHEESARLAAEREAGKAVLLPAYTEKLKELESTLTKADRIPEALEVKNYREGLAMETAPAAPVVATMPVPTAPMTSTANATVARVKGDDRKAAEWILANWKEHRVFAGNTLIKGPADLPSGRFELTSIRIAGEMYTGALPLDGGELLQNLGGLEKLTSLALRGFPTLTDSDFAFISTLESLVDLKLGDNSGITDEVLEHLVGLRVLKILHIAESKGFTGAKLVRLGTSPIEELQLFKCGIDDGGIAGLAGFKKLRILLVNGEKVSDATLPVIRDLPALESLFVASTKITPARLADVPMPRVTQLGCNALAGLPLKDIAPQVAPAFPNVARFQISYTVRTAEDFASLAHFKKLKALSNAGSIEDAAWPGLLELRDLESFTHYSDATPISDAALTILAQLKKLKRLDIGSSPPTPAALAAFKAARPDVEITN